MERTKSTFKIEMTRLQNQQQQVQRIQTQRQQPTATTANYLGRSAVSGFRRMQGGDGGVFYSRWLANSAPGGKVKPVSVTVSVHDRAMGGTAKTQQRSV